jgi:hypothetical protein
MPTKPALHRIRLAAAVLFAAVQESGVDAVDGSSTGTGVPLTRSLLRLPRFGGAKHANGYDNRFRYRQVSFSGARR